MTIKQWENAPEMAINPKTKYFAKFQTEVGDMTFELTAEKTPVTVNSFIFLAREGFYDNTIFHRVISDFMAQGGDPTGTGRGGPGYRFQDEFHPTLRHSQAGVLSMANAGPGTNGSQFFITHLATPHLDGKHSVFGQLIEGMETLYKIPERDPMRPNNPGVKILSISIQEIAG